MKVLVCGSRSWEHPTWIGRRLAQLPERSTIVHGDSPGGGADLFADIYGRALGHEVIPVPINSDDRFLAGRTKRAPIFRNIRMFKEHPDIELVLAFWDGKSSGTKHMLHEAERRALPVEVVRSPG